MGIDEYNNWVYAASKVGVPEDVGCTETLDLLKKWVRKGVLSEEAYNDFKQLVHSKEVSCVEIEEKFKPIVPIHTVQELFEVLNKIITSEAEQKSNEIFKDRFKNWCKEAGGEYNEAKVFETTYVECIFPEEKEVDLSAEQRLRNITVSISTRKVPTPEEPYAIYAPPTAFEVNLLNLLTHVKIEGKGEATIDIPDKATLSGIAKRGIGASIRKDEITITFR